MDHIDRDYRIVCGEKVLLIRGASGNVTLSLPAKMTANDMVKAWLKKGTASAYKITLTSRHQAQSYVVEGIVRTGTKGSFPADNPADNYTIEIHIIGPCDDSRWHDLINILTAQ